MKLSQAAHNIETTMRSPTSTSFDTTSADEFFLLTLDDLHPKKDEKQREESWEHMTGAAPLSWQGTSSSHHAKDRYHSPSWRRRSTNNPHGTTKRDPKHHPDATDHHHKNGILQNRRDDHPTLVPCRYESKEANAKHSSDMEPDVGILLHDTNNNCPSGTTCRRVGAFLSDGTSSESEGLCIPNLSLQQDYPQSVDDHRMLDQQASSDYYGSLLFCTEEGSSFWDNYYYGCDCSAFDAEAQQGSFSCEMYDYYCFGRNGQTTGERTSSSTHQQPCGSLTLQRTLDGTYETSEYCYTLTNQHHLDEPIEICYAYSTEGITDNGVGECSISIDGVTCQSCYIPTDGVELYEGGRVLYGCFAFDCTNTPVPLEGVDCLGDYVMEAVASGDGDDHLNDPTLAPTMHWTRAPTRAPTAHPAPKSPVTTAPPTESPSDGPSSGPSTSPSTASPTTSHPSLRPSHSPTVSPSMGPTGMPLSNPSSSPTTSRPSSAPSMIPTDGLSTRLDDTTTGGDGIGIDIPTTPEESSPVPSSQPTEMSSPSTSSPSTTSNMGDEDITDRTEPSPPTKAPSLSPTEVSSAASPHAGNSKRYSPVLLAIGVGGLLLL